MRYLLLLALPFLSFSQKKLSLLDAIQLAKSQNPYSKVYEYNLEAQKADKLTAEARPNLLFNQQSIFLTNKNYLDAIRPNQTLGISPYGSQLWFQITKQFQVNDKRAKKIDLQQKEIDYSQIDIRRFKNDVVYAASINWLEAWHAKINLHILIEAKDNIDSLLTINKIRLKNQAITALELSRNKLISDQFGTQINFAKQDYQTKLKKLSFLIGLPSIEAIDTNASFFIKDFPDSLNGLVNVAYNERADLQANITLSKVSSSNIELQKSIATPNPEAGVVFNPQNTLPYFGWYFQMPIAVFDKNKGNIQRAKIEHEQNLEQIAFTKKQIAIELSYYLQEYETNKANSENYRLILEDADNILKNVRFSYLRGGTTIVDYLLAQQKWLETQKDYYNSLYLYRMSYLSILNAIGILSND